MLGRYQRLNQGFTLIELVIVIAIIAILAAVAIPKFVDLTSNANTAALSGVAGALASANATNYAARQMSTTITGTASIVNCTDAAALLQGGLPSGYTIAPSGVSAGSTVTCTLSNSSGSTTTFTINGTN
jgi:prepilin-type N-terminal cleavage/methylation domain-containing protein